MRAYQISGIFRDTAWVIPEIMSYSYEGRCSFKDYSAGLYFDRDWVANGADPNLMGGTSSPTMEVKEESVSIRDGCICRRFQITVRVQDCQDCEVIPDAVSLLNAFVEELYRLQQFSVDGETYWMPPERAEQLRTDGYSVYMSDNGIFPVELTRRRTISKPVQDAARTEVIICMADPVERDYGQPLLPHVLVTDNCHDC